MRQEKICQLGNNCQQSHEVRNYPCKMSILLDDCDGKCGFIHDERKLHVNNHLFNAFLEDNYEFFKKIVQQKKNIDQRYRQKIINYVQKRLEEEGLKLGKEKNEEKQVQKAEPKVHSTNIASINLQGMPTFTPPPPSLQSDKTNNTSSSTVNSQELQNKTSIQEQENINQPNKLPQFPVNNPSLPGISKIQNLPPPLPHLSLGPLGIKPLAQFIPPLPIPLLNPLKISPHIQPPVINNNNSINIQKPNNQLLNNSFENMGQQNKSNMKQDQYIKTLQFEGRNELEQLQKLSQQFGGVKQLEQEVNIENKPQHQEKNLQQRGESLVSDSQPQQNTEEQISTEQNESSLNKQQYNQNNYQYQENQNYNNNNNGTGLKNNYNNYGQFQSQDYSNQMDQNTHQNYYNNKNKNNKNQGYLQQQQNSYSKNYQDFHNNNNQNNNYFQNQNNFNYQPNQGGYDNTQQNNNFINQNQNNTNNNYYNNDCNFQNSQGFNGQNQINNNYIQGYQKDNYSNNPIQNQYNYNQQYSQQQYNNSYENINQQNQELGQREESITKISNDPREKHNNYYSERRSPDQEQYNNNNSDINKNQKNKQEEEEKIVENQQLQNNQSTQKQQQQSNDDAKPKKQLAIKEVIEQELQNFPDNKEELLKNLKVSLKDKQKGIEIIGQMMHNFTDNQRASIKTIIITLHSEKVYDQLFNNYQQVLIYDFLVKNEQDISMEKIKEEFNRIQKENNKTRLTSTDLRQIMNKLKDSPKNKDPRLKMMNKKEQKI